MAILHTKKEQFIDDIRKKYPKYHFRMHGVDNFDGEPKTHLWILNVPEDLINTMNQDIFNHALEIWKEEPIPYFIVILSPVESLKRFPAKEKISV